MLVFEKFCENDYLLSILENSWQEWILIEIIGEINVIKVIIRKIISEWPFRHLSYLSIPLHSISPLPPLLLGGATSPTFLGESQILKTGDQKKYSAWRVLKCPCHRYLPGGDLLCFLSKRLWRLKCGFEGWIFKCQSSPVLAKQPINV